MKKHAPRLQETFSTRQRARERRSLLTEDLHALVRPLKHCNFRSAIVCSSNRQMDKREQTDQKGAGLRVLLAGSETRKRAAGRQPSLRVQCSYRQCVLLSKRLGLSRTVARET